MQRPSFEWAAALPPVLPGLLAHHGHVQVLQILRQVPPHAWESVTPLVHLLQDLVLAPSLSGHPIDGANQARAVGTVPALDEDQRFGRVGTSSVAESRNLGSCGSLVETVTEMAGKYRAPDK
jgi:hypothetical protein